LPWLLCVELAVNAHMQHWLGLRVASVVDGKQH